MIMLLGLNAGSVQAKVYKFVDENGQVHYSGTKPVNNKSKKVDINSGRSGRTLRKIKLIPNKDLDKAVRDGKITETIAIRMRHFNIVSKEYSMLKKKKKAMKIAIASAKSSQATISVEQIALLKQKYNIFVKEELYYAKRNYLVSRKKIRALLDSHSKKKSRSVNNKKQAVKIEWR